MRLPLLLTALLLAAAAPDDAALTHYDLVPTDVRDALFIDVTVGDFWTPPPSPALRALDAAGRVAAVKAFAQFAKAYTSSSDFQSRYSKWRTHELGEAPKKPPSYEEFVKTQNQLASQSAKQIQDQMKAMPPDQQEQLKQMQAQMEAMTQSMTPEQKAQMQQMLGQAGVAPGADAKTDKQVYEETVIGKYKEEKAAYEEKLAKSPEKSSAAVKAALKNFLAGTADVDFDAKLVPAGAHQVFADDAKEAKPELWKRAFRAGKETTEAARQAAKSWLAELK